MGCLEEHSFIGWDGLWIVGIPAKNTTRLGDLRGKDIDHVVNDILPSTSMACVCLFKEIAFFIELIESV
jgi:hypothetical protein